LTGRRKGDGISGELTHPSPRRKLGSPGGEALPLHNWEIPAFAGMTDVSGDGPLDDGVLRDDVSAGEVRDADQAMTPGSVDNPVAAEPLEQAVGDGWADGLAVADLDPGVHGDAETVHDAFGGLGRKRAVHRRRGGRCDLGQRGFFLPFGKRLGLGGSPGLRVFGHEDATLSEADGRDPLPVKALVVPSICYCSL
jgi:hypothetical protein